MKTKIYYSLLLMLFVCCVQTVSAQTETNSIVYSYDAAGNRISRQLLVSKIDDDTPPISEVIKSDNNTETTPTNTAQQLIENVGNKQITVYPNPTDGILQVNISNLDINDKGAIKLSGVNGAELLKTETLQATNTINISDKPNGMYLMKVTLNGKETVWKIVKN